MATDRQLGELTNCPVCTEHYHDPRVLPCGHTFCLKCIRAWRPGNKLACALCKRFFTMPASGVDDLPKNYVAANLLRKLSSTETRASSSHGARDLEKSPSGTARGRRRAPINLATPLAFNKHNHQRSDSANDNGGKARGDVDRTTAAINKCEYLLRTIDKQKKRWSEQIGKAAIAIGTKAETTKKTVERQRKKLMSELYGMKEQKMAAIELVRSELNEGLTFYRKARGPTATGNGARPAAPPVDLRLIESKLADLSLAADVTFTSCDFASDDDAHNTLGQLVVNTVETGET